jgi:hypothetical protein
MAVLLETFVVVAVLIRRMQEIETFKNVVGKRMPA